jgi:hypothetical protein
VLDSEFGIHKEMGIEIQAKDSSMTLYWDIVSTLYGGLDRQAPDVQVFCGGYTTV